MSPNSSDTQSNPNHELTLGDVIGFIAKAKWFGLTGIAIGVLVASLYLAYTPAVYQSSVTIQIQSTNGTNTTIIPAEFLERLTLRKTIDQLTDQMQPAPSPSDRASLQDAIKSATLSKSGNLLTLNIKTNSADVTQKLASQLGSGIIALINQLNAPKIVQLQKVLTLKKSLLASSNKMADTTNLQISILELELTLSSQENLKPIIVDGPSASETPITPKFKPTLLLGALLGLALGMALFYLKANFLINRSL